MENTTGMNSTEKKGSGWPLWIRIISMLLAVLFIFELALAGSSRVKFSADDYSGTPAELAADYIGENDEYITADRLRRMRAVARTMGTPKTYEEYSLFASVAIADGSYEKAIEYLSACVGLCEGGDIQLSNIYLKIGCLRSLLSDWEKAADAFEKTVNLNSESSNGYIMLCEARLNSGDYERALSALEAYGKLESYNPEQLEALIQMNLALGRADEALAECDRALEENLCDRGTVLCYKAQAACIKGDYDAAKTYAKDCRDSGYNTEAEVITVMYCGAQEDYQGAYEACRVLIGSSDAGFDIYEQAAQYAYMTEHYTEAIDFCEKAFDKFGSNGQTETLRRWMGISQVETKDYVNAEKNLTAFLEKDGTMPELYYLRGVSRMANGTFDTAAEDFTAGLESEEIKDRCLYNRGLCYLKLDEDTLAALDFQEIIERNRDPETLQLTCDLLGIDEKELQQIREELASGGENSGNSGK